MSTKLQTSNIGDSDCDLLSWGQKKSPNVKIGANSLIVLSGELIVTKSSNYARLQPNRSHSSHSALCLPPNKTNTNLPHTGLPDKNNFQLLATLSSSESDIIMPPHQLFISTQQINFHGEINTPHSHLEKATITIIKPKSFECWLKFGVHLATKPAHAHTWASTFNKSGIKLGPQPDNISAPTTATMSKLVVSIVLLAFIESLVSGCLITNCPRGGKRSKFGLAETSVKPVRTRWLVGKNENCSCSV
jgi:hypothetical protein